MISTEPTTRTPRPYKGNSIRSWTLLRKARCLKWFKRKTTN